MSVTQVPNIEAASAALKDSLPRLERAMIQEQRARLARDIASAQQHGDEARARQLMQERDQLLRSQHTMSPRGENGG